MILHHSKSSLETVKKIYIYLARMCYISSNVTVKTFIMLQNNINAIQNVSTHATDHQISLLEWFMTLKNEVKYENHNQHIHLTQFSFIFKIFKFEVWQNTKDIPSIQPAEGSLFLLLCPLLNSLTDIVAFLKAIPDAFPQTSH